MSLGHRRLAIVDLSVNGAQPMATGDDQRHIVFNGEIYNHQELRADLDAKLFRGHSDTETLLELLTRHGPMAAKRLNGIFALAYVDLKRHKLYLIRDPFGVKPLYYHVSERRLAFSSELRPLLQLVPAEPDIDALRSLLRLRFSPSPETAFLGLRKLRPGHILEIDLSSEALSWSETAYLEPVPRRRRINFQDALSEYGSLFKQAVRRQLMSDVEIGVLLSGGVDSALVAAHAQQAAEQPLKAFTVGFSGSADQAVDEIDEAAETARVLGMEHLITRIDFDQFIDTLRTCVGIVEEPLATTSVVPMHFLSRLAGQHVKVVLSGQGADEPLGGYTRYQGELYQRFVPSWLAQIGRVATGRAGVRNDTLRRGLDALSQSSELARFMSAYTVFSNDEVERLTGARATDSQRSLEYLYDLLGCQQIPESVARMMSVDLRFGLSDDLLLYTDKVTMRESLECRVPMLDLDLARFIESLPASFRVRLRQTKIIHKRFAETTLPGALVHRSKKGFLSPTRVWFRDRERLRGILLDHESVFSRYFDPAAVDHVLAEHEAGYNRERHIFLLLSLYFWFAEYFS